MENKTYTIKDMEKAFLAGRSKISWANFQKEYNQIIDERQGKDPNGVPLKNIPEDWDYLK